MVAVTLSSTSILSQSYVTIPITISTAQSSTGNQVNFRDGCVMTLSITYTGGVSQSPSTGWLNKSSVEVGDSISLSISSSSATNWHGISWSLGTLSWYQEVFSGGSSTVFTIPESWASAITGSSATGRVTLTTYDAYDMYIGSSSYTFTVTLSTSSSAPVIGSFYGNRVDGEVPSSWGVYVQGKSKIQLVISGASGSAGSSISTYRFSGGGYAWSSSTDYTYTTGFLTTAGANTFTGTVTDTRGYSANRTLSVNVLPYETPSVTFMETYRAAADDTPSETGPNIIVRFTSSYSSVDGKNTLTRYFAFRRVGASTWSGNYTASADGGWRLPANLPSTDTAPYEIRMMLVDALSTTTQIFDVQGAQYTMFFANGGKNVSIGMAGSRANALEINPAWSIYHGNTNITPRLSGTLGVPDGGTGATTPAGALTNLGAAAASHAHNATDITSGVLTVARGGTGASALTANRALVTNASGNVATANVTSTQLGYLANVYSDIQQQINNLSSGGSGPKMAYGSTYIDGNNAAYINYSYAGFSYVPQVVVTYSTTGSNWSGDNGAIKVYYKSTSGANIIVGGSFGTSRQVDWIAIGA